MRNLLKKLLVIGMVCSLIHATPVFAGSIIEYEGEKINIEQEIPIQLGNRDINKSRSINSTRGAYISSSIAGVTNVGGGIIGISAATTAHVPVDKIRIHLYLDRLNQSGKWIQVDDFDYYFYPEDEPDGELTIAAVDLEVDDQPAGYYYRVRGTHGVWKNGTSESQTTRSDGVMITNP